ncbi:MAG: adenylate/guanylate cyclase domain-containing protein, partial [Cyclobacteriaceae bacterium]|nr:adenylate/guanylate cyclase domain-containing protein [Cyclobacteriaceae bacterium]
MSQSRQLAAIMFTDIVGYTELMGSDDKKAFSILKKNREIQKPVIEECNGRWIKEMGDGTIASFNTASDALAAAKKIQEACAAVSDLQLRIGIHLGEVVFENNDVFGDGVNIASRIESLGIAGAVLISKAIRDQVKNKSDLQLISLGYFDFKNVSEPMEVFALANPGFAVPRREEMQGKLKHPHKKSSALTWIIAIAVIAAASFSIWLYKGQKETSIEPRDQSIAVLAFVDMSPAKDQEYFSDGLSENVIDMLAKVPALKVIGRTSSFSFKGKNEDLRAVGEKLGAANILEGSVQRDGNMLRITAQLIRSADGFHLWSEKFDRPLKDIFAIQDEIALAILEAIKIELVGEGKEDMLKKHTDNIEAFELVLKGRYHYNKFTPDNFLKAIEYYQS